MLLSVSDRDRSWLLRRRTRQRHERDRNPIRSDCSETANGGIPRMGDPQTKKGLRTPDERCRAFVRVEGDYDVHHRQGDEKMGALGPPQHLRVARSWIE